MASYDDMGLTLSVTDTGNGAADVAGNGGAGTG